MAYLVSDSDNLANHPLYVVDEGLGSCMLHLSNEDTSGVLQVEKKKPIYHTTEKEDELWQMYFDGSSSKEGAGAGIVLISLGGENVCLMYKLEFQKTNNVAEYEALVLGLRDAKDLGIQQLPIFGNSELVVQQVRSIYQVKQQLLKVYKNEVWDLIDNLFTAFNISFIPRDHNHTTDSLALATTFFKVPQNTQLRYPIEVRNRPSIPDNIKHWKVFQDDLEIKKFLELTGEFSNSQIDEEQDDDDGDEFPSFIEQSIVDHNIIELKGNFIPKGLVPLEILFLKDDTLAKSVVQSFE